MGTEDPLGMAPTIADGSAADGICQRAVRVAASADERATYVMIARVLLASLLSGCTLVGGGIGALIPRTLDPEIPNGTHISKNSNDPMVFELTARARMTAREGRCEQVADLREQVRKRDPAYYYGVLVIDGDVRECDTRGSYAGAGFLIGLIADVIVIAGAISIAKYGDQ